MELESDYKLLNGSVYGVDKFLGAWNQGMT